MVLDNNQLPWYPNRWYRGVRPFHMNAGSPNLGVRPFLQSAVSPNVGVWPPRKSAVSPNLGVRPFLRRKLFVLMGGQAAHMTAQIGRSLAVLGPKGYPHPPRTTNCHGTLTDGSREQPTAIVAEQMVPWSAAIAHECRLSPNLGMRSFIKNAVFRNLEVRPFLKGMIFVLMGASRAHHCTNWPCLCRDGAVGFAGGLA